MDIVSKEARAYPLESLEVNFDRVNWCALPDEGSESFRLFFCGGTCNGVLNRAYTIDLALGEVNEAVPMLVARYAHGICYLSGYIFVFGGFNDKNIAN
jgi:hypothetical protein